MKISYLADCPQEAKTIAQWYFDEWAYAVPEVTVEKVLDNVKSNATSRAGSPLIMTLHEDHQLCACAELKLRENKNHPEYENWVGGVYVQENYRGRGYASALLDKAKQHTLQHNIKTLYLQCEDKNIALYLKQGCVSRLASRVSRLASHVLIGL